MECPEFELDFLTFIAMAVDGLSYDDAVRSARTELREFRTLTRQQVRQGCSGGDRPVLAREAQQTGDVDPPQ